MGSLPFVRLRNHLQDWQAIRTVCGKGVSIRALPDATVVTMACQSLRLRRHRVGARDSAPGAAVPAGWLPGAYPASRPRARLPAPPPPTRRGPQTILGSGLPVALRDRPETPHPLGQPPE